MLKQLVTWSLHHRGVAITLAAILAIYGGFKLTHAQYSVFPEFAPPQVVIQTQAPGFSPRQVEKLVTTPIENVINGVIGIASMRSVSTAGISVIKVTFGQNTNVYLDRQFIAERLANVASQLPSGAETPTMTPLTSSTGKVLIFGLTSKTRSLMDVHTVAQWTVRRRLLAIKGVSDAVVFGGQVRQLQVQLHPVALEHYGLSIAQIAHATSLATGIRAAGFIDTPNQRIQIQAEGQATTPARLATAIVAMRHGVPVTLGDVATVTYAPAPPVGAASIDGHPGVQILVWAQYGTNTLVVTRRVDAALHALEPVLAKQHIKLWPDLFRPASFVHRAVGNLGSALTIGGVLVAIMLFLFLFNWRTALISLAAIPLSLLTATLLLQMFGYTLNTMTLGGLAIAIGLLVDDAVITVENIYRRLSENNAQSAPRSTLRVIRDATLEVRSAVVYATLAIAMVFVPVMTLPGVAGRLFAPLGYAYVLATLASLLVALTVTPVLCMFWLARGSIPSREPPLIRWIKPGYRYVLLRIDRHYRWVFAAVLLMVLLGASALPFFGARFIPQLKEGHYIIHMVMTAGTSLEQSLRMGKIVSAHLEALPFVESVTQHVGRAPESHDVLGTNTSEFDVALKPMGGPATVTARQTIQNVVDAIPGATFAVKTFLSARIQETISGQRAPVVVHVFGLKLNQLGPMARQVAAILRTIPGATGVQMQSQPNSPSLVIRLEPSALARWGLYPVDVLDTLHTAYGGDVVGQIYTGDRIFDVTVSLPSSQRRDPSIIGNLLLRASDGVTVPLRDVAMIYATRGPKAILHEGGRRVITVTSGVTGRDNASFVRAAKAALDSKLELPHGAYLEFAGSAQEQKRATTRLLLTSLIAAVFIVLLLSLVLTSMRNLALILANIPFALIGGVLGIFVVFGGTLSMGGMVGFVTLFGITLRNGMMMIAHYEHLVYVEGEGWNKALAIRGAQERLAPILMTTLVTAFGLLPLAVGRQAPGNAIDGPMAIVILSGLMTSAVLNLLVLPSMVLRFGRFKTTG
ncbi:acriflavin resistance protein [Acidihalobacter yilgarnensis]|uniref:Acriflavin resistance protein n=1 Tax=Acidihalobacter yilgarnensis TaxID=2819280 RepID=A0A1D8IR17_9GAMM|nr:efflux RND transporter permease subunit [Acidihalobacter yilgarnensis]AOU98847.1 acriflavin resistance protein [Acidihalobacter yilgarnensis]